MLVKRKKSKREFRDKKKRVNKEKIGKNLEKMDHKIESNKIRKKSRKK